MMPLPYMLIIVIMDLLIIVIHHFIPFVSRNGIFYTLFRPPTFPLCQLAIKCGKIKIQKKTISKGSLQPKSKQQKWSANSYTGSKEVCSFLFSTQYSVFVWAFCFGFHFNHQRSLTQQHNFHLDFIDRRSPRAAFLVVSQCVRAL